MRGMKAENNYYAGGFIYDNVPPFDDQSDDGEYIVYRAKYKWLIEAFEEYMPQRLNSEFMWAVHVKNGQETNITEKVKKELENAK